MCTEGHAELEEVGLGQPHKATLVKVPGKTSLRSLPSQCTPYGRLDGDKRRPKSTTSVGTYALPDKIDDEVHNVQGEQKVNEYKKEQ